MPLQPLVEVLTVTSEGKRNGLVVGKESVRCMRAWCVCSCSLLPPTLTFSLYSLSLVFSYILQVLLRYGVSALPASIVA